MARRRHYRRMNPLNPLNPISTPGCVFGAVVIGAAAGAIGYYMGKKAATPTSTTASLTVPASTTPATTTA